MYDIIGDIHGCFHEFMLLTKKLGYVWEHDIPFHAPLPHDMARLL